MPSLTLSEITYYRSQLADYPDEIAALDEIIVCDGDLDDAAINLALTVGQTPDRTDWLEGLAKRYRVEICQENPGVGTNYAECQAGQTFELVDL